jgi:hypothetical protein
MVWGRVHPAIGTPILFETVSVAPIAVCLLENAAAVLMLPAGRVRGDVFLTAPCVLLDEDQLMRCGP